MEINQLNYKSSPYILTDVRRQHGFFLKSQSASDLQSFEYFRKLYIEMVVNSYREKKTIKNNGFKKCRKLKKKNRRCVIL